MIVTPSSPEESLIAYELMRYPDCSEILSLTGKVAERYALNFIDAVVHITVNEIESLTTGLSR